MIITTVACKYSLFFRLSIFIVYFIFLSPVLKWMQETNRKCESKLMEKTQFIDLEIRLGYPYLFTHLGNCEHTIV